MSDMIEILKELPLFSELNNEDLKRLEAITKKKTYPKRQYVFMEGDPREAVYFIQEGTVKTFKVDENGNEQVINLLQKGEMFPHVGFFDETPYPATAETVERTELFVIRIDDFDQLMMQNPEIAIKVMRIMGQKIFMLAERVQELISEDVRHRIVHALLRFSKEIGKPKNNGISIELPITNRDFANMVGSTRETINRVLNQLKKEGILEADRNGMFIHDLKRLKSFYGKG
ncbi:MAG TPA: Crp/Fnr family transcriptional regulator [Bacillales bacterium]|nr:Crp/Fnr family transcriptional regulator [Bacillales bacterium]